MRWTLDDIAWQRFDPALVDPRLVCAVKAAALVEANSADYVIYLGNVFADDPGFGALIAQWGREEAQHGAALARWAALADPAFESDRALCRFRAGYRLPLDAMMSVRGSQAGEMISRQVVETATSSLYSALRDASAEPVLRQICAAIAIDEFAHYQLFRKAFRRYQGRAPLGRFTRLRIALGRMLEAGDDELARAYHAANCAAEPYDRQRHGRAYRRLVAGFYQRAHIDSAARMILRAAALPAHGWLGDATAALFWGGVRALR